MSEATVLVEIHERVAVLTINRPSVRNALNNATYLALSQQLQILASDESLRAIILTGANQYFTAGNDLKDFLAQPDDVFEGLSFLTNLRNSPIPVIAAVEGVAIGIGCTLLLHCDFVFAAENAVFAMPFNHLGLCPEGGASTLLAQQVGVRKANEWLYFGQSFSAQEAKDSGFINAVCPAGQSLAMAQQAAVAMSQFSRLSLSATKSLLRENQHVDPQIAFESERVQFVKCLHSPEAQTAFAKFLKK